jgi:hypothetical protein
MKKLILLLSIPFSLSVSAQQDTIIVNNDTIIKPVGAILVENVIVSAQGDTAFSMDFVALNVKSDTLSGCNTYVTLQSRRGNVISDFNQWIPADVLKRWDDNPSPIFDHILANNPRLKRKTLIKK